MTTTTVTSRHLHNYKQSNGSVNTIEETSSINGVISSEPSNFHFRDYVIATRPWSFTASLTPAFLGNVLVYIDQGGINIPLAIIGIVCILAVHCAGNLVNTYYDFQTGVDDELSDDQTLVHGILKPNAIVKLCAGSYVIGCLCFAILLVMSNSKIEYLMVLFFAGVSGSFFYTGSIGMKYHALGDVLIMLTFGPVAVLYAYVLQVGQLSWQPFMYAIPLMLHTEAILHSNNSRDIEGDQKAGILTLAIILGKEYSYLLYLILLFSPYLFVLVLSLTWSKLFMLPFLTLPLALELARKFRSHELQNVTQATAKLNLFFGVLYILVFLLQSFF